MRRIFLIGGGTGGHLFPAISIAQELENRGFATALITDIRCVKYLPDGFMQNSIILNIVSPASQGWRKLWSVFTMIMAFLRMLRVFYLEKPSMLIAFGGYPTAPALMAAKVMSIPIILHEQNSFLGKVNRQFSKYATLLALNFKDTNNLDQRARCQVAVVGNPVREEIAACSFTKNFDNNSFTILVVGGSQGASFFDQVVPNAIELLAQQTSRPIKVIQQAAKVNHQHLINYYHNINIECEVADFFRDMPTKYQTADIVICRSGASTIAELIYVGLPAILIPLPTAANDHQTYNAKLLTAKGGAIFLTQLQTDSKVLAQELIQLEKDRAKLEHMSKNLLEMQIDGTKNFTDRIISILVCSSLT